MAERIFVGVAWPYSNGPLHVGHIAGCYLPADIFARYHRLAGNEVLMVSGSDAHGTPNTVRAEQEGVHPQVIVDRYHASFLETWQRLGISFDLYTSTQTENHIATTQAMFLRLLERGYIRKDVMTLPYCPRDNRFLPDRYVLGTCPRCGFTDARGDECDSCGHPLDPFDLTAPRCRFCGASPVPKESEHFFLQLPAFVEQLRAWVKEQLHWRPNVYNFTLRYLEEGLKARAFTRDIEWGVPIPLPGYERKRLYVWFENVIGYLSASKEWAQRRGDPERWRDFWEPGAAKSYYFIGKDNIFFHTLWWPAELIGHGDLALPYDVPANEFMNLEGRPISTSRNWAVWLPDYLERYEADPLRYYVAAVMPESADSDFSWREYFRRNNDELVGTWGNLAHRVLTFAVRHFGGIVPEAGPLLTQDNALRTKAEDAFSMVGASLSRCRFREALRGAFELAQEVNRYWDAQAPWRTLASDRQRTAITVAVALDVINALKILLAPFLPHSSEKLHYMLGFTAPLESQGWSFRPVPAGLKLASPEPLFTKLDEGLVAQEMERLAVHTPAS